MPEGIGLSKYFIVFNYLLLFSIDIPSGAWMGPKFGQLR
jgi:hypothetical protein